MLFLITLLVLIHLNRGFMATATCPGFFKGCCPDSKWDERKASCVECTAGFTGVNCSLQCKYPYYGKSCHGHCNCNNITCDPEIGCLAEESAMYIENMNILHIFLILFGIVLLVVFTAFVIFTSVIKCSNESRRNTTETERRHYATVQEVIDITNN